MRDEKGHRPSDGSTTPGDVQFPKSGYNTNASRMSAYDNLTSERAGSIGQRERNCDKRLIDGVTSAEQRTSRTDTLRGKMSGSEAAMRWVSQNSDTLRSKRHYDSGSVIDDNEDAQTIFSEPWDSSRWENLLLEPAAWEENVSESTIRVSGEPVLNTDDDDTVLETPKKPRSVSRGKSFKERLDPLLCK